MTAIKSSFKYNCTIDIISLLYLFIKSNTRIMEENMEIKMPRSFDLDQSLKFTLELDCVPKNDKYVYDYSQLGTVEPFGMLLVSSKIRKFILDNSEAKHYDTSYEDNEYAAHMGFFQSVRLDYGKKPGKAKGNSNYIPLTEINIDDSYYTAVIENGICIEEYIEKEFANKLASILSRENDKIKEVLIFCITEIIRNVYDHSVSKTLWFSGQYWPSKDRVEIAILDEGKGIANTLKRNKKNILNNDEEALKLCIKPGVTKSLESKKAYDIYSNKGFGLFMISRICEIGGNFVICSGKSCLIIDKNGIESKKCSFNGTAIRLILNPSKMGEIRLSDIAKEGEELINIPK